MAEWFKQFKALFKPRNFSIDEDGDELQSFSDIGITSRRWWGTYQVEDGQSRFWRIGNVVICVDRVTNEWHIASCPVGKITDLPDTDSGSDEANNFKIPFERLNFKTFTFHTQAEIELKPVLANRPLASKLERPLYIPGGEDILLYVSSPVWVRVQTGKSKIILDEVATFVLSDTWFGPNTREGELCYAGHTHCSPHLKDVPSGPDRIISPMLIKNHAKKPLKLENISVPLPFLSVYSDAENFLWTEQLYVYREEDSGPEVEVAKGPPKALDELKLLTRARKDIRSSSSIKRFFVSNLVGD
jgi:hypothetical protein